MRILKERERERDNQKSSNIAVLNVSREIEGAHGGVNTKEYTEQLKSKNDKKKDQTPEDEFAQITLKEQETKAKSPPTKKRGRPSKPKNEK